jgi:hypothetical protein
MHDNASEHDMFMGAASGGGLLYPSIWSDKKAWVEDTVDGMKTVGHRIATVVDYESGYSVDNLGQLLDDDQVDAILFSAVQSSDFETRQMLWHNDKPIIPMRRLGFSDIRTADEVDSFVEELMGGGLSIGSLSSNGYTMIYANLATTRLSDLQAVEDALNAAGFGAFQVVRPDTLIQMVTDLVSPETTGTKGKTGS